MLNFVDKLTTSKLMKKTISILALMLMLPFIMFSTPLSNTDKKPSTDVPPPVIVIIIMTPNPLPGQPRTVVQSPIECEYNAYVNGICTTFYHDLGEVEVVVENMLTGECFDCSVDSAAGYAVLPISGTSGYYTVSFITESGAEYSGEFEL